MIDFSGNIKIEDRYGTWYEIDRAKASDGNEYILFESEQYGDEANGVLCILPKDSEVKHVIGKKSGKEFIQIPKEFEVEETADNIIDALEQDLGLEVINESITEEVVKEDLSKRISEEERDTIQNFFKRQQLLWSNYPDVIQEYYDGDDYVVELDNSNPTYIADTRESLNDLCEKLDIGYDENGNDNGFYGKTYIFYHFEDDMNENIEVIDVSQVIKCEPNEGHFNGDVGFDESYETFEIFEEGKDTSVFVNFYGYGEDDVDIDWEYETDTWDDPGVYPSNAGGYALPSYDYEYLSGGTLNKSFIDKSDLKYDFFDEDGKDLTKEQAAQMLNISVPKLESIIEKCKDQALVEIEKHIEDYIEDKVERGE